MSNIRLEAYLFFKGNCREAMEFYKSIFGGELTLLKLGAQGVEPATSEDDRIMHARLEGGDVVLMASDGDSASPKAAKISLSLTGSNEARLREIFDGLSEGVEVEHPLKKEVWGDIFGGVVDKYGVDWMVNVSEEKQ